MLNNSRKEKVKTRDLWRKIGNIKGAFHPKTGTIKGKNGRDLVDAEEIKKRWKEYMEEQYKKYLNELDWCGVTNYNGVVSHPEPDILENEVKWALRSTAVNKASGCNEILAELFKSLKDDAIKCCIHYVSKSGRRSSGHRTGKSQSSSQFPRRVVPKNVLTIGELH